MHLPIVPRDVHRSHDASFRCRRLDVHYSDGDGVGLLLPTLLAAAAVVSR